ncbi:MAG: methionine ABC transporter ATP-binding protein [Deltaproteobacteria bacterium]|jgi:D-methionine transport system ATP-binding protein|nr:methionine ABC transporter ATP-binding protein [Deltaproteobacteria bacterium]
MIEVSALCKAFGRQTVLRDISMSVRRGEIFGIVGHSGAGKSTLLRCLNGLETYDSGSVKIMGQEVGELAGSGVLQLRRAMGMIFQDFSLMSRKNVFENVAFPLKVWNTPWQRMAGRALALLGKSGSGAERTRPCLSAAQIHERVMSLLDMVGLAHKSGERIQSLSGGQKQRVGIARALALNPGILLCDEATSALDPQTTMSILDLLEDINRKLNLTIVLVTHQMEVVKRLCHRLLLLDAGVSQAVGRTEDLFLTPPDNLKKFIDEEFTVLPAGINIRLTFPREIAQQSIITGMARDLDIDFSIVGGKLERYLDDVFGFLIINVQREQVEAVLAYLRGRQIPGQILDEQAPGHMRDTGV